MRAGLKQLKFSGDSDYCSHEGAVITLSDKTIDTIIDLFITRLEELKKQALEYSVIDEGGYEASKTPLIAIPTSIIDKEIDKMRGK